MSAGDQTIKGNLTVNGSATVGGNVQARSVQAFGPTISNFAQAFAELFGSAHVQIAAGGNGVGFLDSAGVERTVILAGAFADPAAISAPPSSLLLRRDPAELWFHADTGWVKVA